eukprot:Phypoly_transcript_18556.p1 GENE.Phypoly_transcript_18556~~Phypoly_transcript_18556.p1  ORF type:complete len:197 (+),score=37.69 Phypoly_transcript_18556:116-706(+)
MIVDEEEASIKSPVPALPPHTHHISDLLHLNRHHHDAPAVPAATPSAVPLAPVQTQHGELTESDINMLIDKAMKAKEGAYAPYSNFRVGAALLDATGKVFTGCNVENASYGLSICAERVTYTKAVSEGSHKFRAIVVSTDVLDRHLPPCGACRQFAAEFGEHRIILVKPDRTYKIFTVDELLPLSFTPRDLEAPKM